MPIQSTVNSDEIVDAINSGFILPVFSPEDVKTFFYGSKRYALGDITIVSYDDRDAIIVEGEVKKGCCFEVVARNDVEQCVLCPICNTTLTGVHKPQFPGSEFRELFALKIEVWAVVYND